MTARHRSRDLRSSICGQYYHWLNAPPKWQTYCVNQGKTEVCDDITGNFGGANGFSLDQKDVTYAYFNGSQWSGSTLLQSCDNLPAYSMNPESTDPLTYYGTCGAICQSNAAWEILSNTNPNVPHFSVPTFFGELKDLPGIVKGWGDNLLRDVARGYISWRWALKPMLNDIRKMADFTEAVDKRVDWLKRLRDFPNAGLRRRCSLGTQSGETSWSSESLIHSSGFQVKAKWRESHFSKKWGSVRYKVASGTQLPRDAKGLRGLAWRLTFGITSHEALATAWELLPWSWFVDWFLGVGQTIQALNNTVPLTSSHLCLMRHSSVKREFQITTKPSWLDSASVPASSRVRKERWLVSPSIPFSLHLPLLDERKWSILAALAVLRR